MRHVNLNGIDLNLIPPLEALLRRRNVTRAALDVGMSQPAMSRALARLRATLEDPLLVRGQGGLVLTPRASALVPVAAVAQLRSVFEPARFDPAVTERVVRMAATDSLAILVAPRLMARLARDAPEISLEMVSYREDLIQRMEEGTIDLAFALASTPLPAGARSLPIATDRLALVMRRGHPAARRKWTLADYGRFEQATVAILGDRKSEMDALLAEAGVTRRIAFTSPHFMAALAVVSATDMVTTISEALARRFADRFGLLIKRPPLADVSLMMTLVWSKVRDHDPVLSWFRSLTKEVVHDVFGERRRP